MVLSRVDQLDADLLDRELDSVFSQQLQDAFKHFIRNPWDSVGPELDAVVKTILCAGSLWARGSSVGQQLLSLKFQDPSRKQLLALGMLNILTNYASARQSCIIRLLPTSHEEKTEKIVKWLGLLFQALEIVNFLVFLQRGTFPLLVHRLLGLKHSSEVTEQRNQQFTYMSRELLWHSLSEMIIFTLPIINSSRISRFFRPSTAKPADKADVCGVCSGPPVMRVTASECGHVFCYYCARAHAVPRCPVCGIALTEDSFKLPQLKKYV